jgi:glycosyltransferase involved in cell wall biosynthesis
MSMIEAMAVGLPLVAASTSLLAPLFEQAGAARLAGDGDAVDWARQAHVVLTSPELLRKQVQAGRELVALRFSEDALRSRLVHESEFGLDASES